MAHDLDDPPFLYVAVEDHRAAAVALAPTPASVRLPLPEAAGMVLAADVTSPRDLPIWDCSAMDGFAVRFADLVEGTPLPVSVDVPAGANVPAELAPGTAARVMTGAPVPAGADTVIPVEFTDVPRGPVALPESFTPHKLPAEGASIRRAGSDVRAGQVVAAAGTTLDALTLGAIAGVGVAEVDVVRRLRLRIVATGDELVPLGGEVGDGKLPDANSWLMAGLARDCGADVERVTMAHDDADALAADLPALLDGADALVFTGGVSAGAFEVVRQALEPRGVEFRAVGMQPGKPQGLGTLDGTAVFCLPGNPVSAVVSFLAFVRPFLDAAAGRPPRPTTTAVLGEGWSKKLGRVQFMPVTLATVDGVLTARRRSGNGSDAHLVSRLAGVDGFAVLPALVDAVAAGDVVEVMMVP